MILPYVEKEGAQFLVVGDGDAVILKVVTPPSMDESEGLIKQAKEADLRAKDIASAVAKVRHRK